MLDRNLIGTSTDQVWIADISYIRILMAFAYQGIPFNMHSRKIRLTSFQKFI
jgi:hypothetical protein